MKTKQLFFLGLLGLLSLTSNAQNVSSTTNLTSGGFSAGTNGLGGTYYGNEAGKSITSNTNSGGQANSFFGRYAGSKITTGAQNVFIGNSSGVDNISGNRNTFVGTDSGLSSTAGSSNVFIGTYSGGENAGSNNTFIGTESGGESTGSNNVFIGKNTGYYESANNRLLIDNSDAPSPLIWGDFALNQLKFNSKVGIGYGFGNYPTTAGSVNVSNYNLFVKGGILTEEVRVSLASGWADYVFNKDYALKPLNEVENFITANGHLPNVPSAKEVKENGIELGEMSKIQQEKIEELTLYAIEQNKTIQSQSKAIEELKAQVKLLLERK